jgi:hypothetical protein
MAKYEVGTTWVMFVAPGWIIGGTVTEDLGDEIVLKDALYFESVGRGRSAFEIATADNMTQQLTVSKSRYPFIDGHRVSKAMIGMSSPCASDFRDLRKHTCFAGQAAK